MKMHSTFHSFFSALNKYTVMAVFMAFLSVPAAAQVGFNNPTPDPSSLLDLNANDRGLLIPRMTGNQRNSIANPAEGLLVFDTDLKIFMFYTGGQWTSLSPWLATDASVGADIKTGDVSIPGTQKVGIGKAPTTALDVNGTVTANTFVGNGTIPVGGIIMWSGSTVPAGWALCDGNGFANGEPIPDLQGRFVVGTGTATGLGAGPTNYIRGNMGGEEKHTLTTNEMPSHNHPAYSSTDGAHTHDIYIDNANNGYNPTTRIHDTRNDQNYWNVTTPTSSAGAHAHTITVQNAGGNGSHENRPPYYALAYIIRIQ